MALFNETVRKEIERWKKFSEVLREDDKAIFNEMIESCYSYAPSINAMGELSANESILMSLLLAQHKLIKLLTNEMEKIRNERLDI